MIISEAISKIKSGGIDAALSSLYGEERTLWGRARYLAAINEFSRLYGNDRDISIFSVSGRSELSGNHTDHNGGKVIAAAIDLDMIAVASACSGSVIRMHSEGFGDLCVDFDSFHLPKAELFGSSEAILAGIASGFGINGFAVGGFDAYTVSDIPVGAGLSSSAAFEDLTGTILNHFYNGGEIDGITLARISKYAETDFFGKPCGLMDQIACSLGGAVAIDFADSGNPRVEMLESSPSQESYALCVVNTGKSHERLTDEYAAIPAEMKSVAAHLGKKRLCELKRSDIIKNVPTLRRECGDRAILRALHFFDENQRVAAQLSAIKSHDLDRFLELASESGRSSFCYLQNIYTGSSPAEQGISLAIKLAEDFLADKKGAVRVHGGGFAGSILAFVPTASADIFKSLTESVFGKGACHILKIRKEGAKRIV